MSVFKPTLEHTRWAITAGGTPSAEISDPDGTLKDGGYGPSGPSSIPSNRDWNWWHQKAYLWHQYMDEVFKLAGTAVGDFSLSGKGTFGGDLEVGGDIVLGGFLKHGDRILPLHSSAWRGQSAGGPALYAGGIFTTALSGGSAELYAPIMLPDGKRITNFSVRVKDNATGPTTVQVTLIRINSVTDSLTVVATTAVSSGSGANQTLPMIPGSTFDVTATNSYALRFLSTAGTGQVGVGMAEVTYIQP